MKEDNKVVMEVEAEVVEETKVEETKKSLLDSKPVKLVQKHWKKIVVGTLLVAAGVAGFNAGKQVGMNSTDTDGDNYNDDTDSDDYDSEDNTTEI